MRSNLGKYWPLLVLYSDGAAEPNPGPGGYGVVIKAPGIPRSETDTRDLRLELSAGYRLTTNNRMELLGVISGLASLHDPAAVTVISDSRYVIDSMHKGWARTWASAGFMRAGSPVPNGDLWAQLLTQSQRHLITWQWVRGHSGVEENERCDQLAQAAAKAARRAAAGTLIDFNYEQQR